MLSSKFYAYLIIFSLSHNNFSVVVELFRKIFFESNLRYCDEIKYLITPPRLEGAGVVLETKFDQTFHFFCFLDNCLAFEL